MVLDIRAELLARGLAPRSATQYVRVIAKADRWCEEWGHELATVPSPIIMEWVHEQPKSWATRKLIRSGLTHYWDLVGREKRPVIKLPPRPRMVCRALEPEEATTLAKAANARNDNPGLSVLLGLYLALRRHETAKLRWDEFRPDWSELYVVGKGGVSAWVPIHPFMAQRLRAWPQRSPWVFPSPRAGRDYVSPATVWEWSRLVAVDAGLSPVPTHVLRHTSLAQANDRTRDLRAVQHFARHSDPHVTSGYTRVTGERLHAVVMALDFVTTGPRLAVARGPSTAEDDGLDRLAA